MGFTNRAHIKKLIFRTLSKYLVYRISMNIFSEEPFLSPTRLYGQYPPSQSYLQNKASEVKVLAPPKMMPKRHTIKKKRH